MTDFNALRTAMVDCQVRPSDVTKFPIIDTMLKVRREVFVPRSMRDVAYAGAHIALGKNRVVLDPRVMAKILDALDVTPADLVLLIGGDLGYLTAVVANMAEAVIAVEEDEAMAAEAEENLSAEAVDNAVIVTGALVKGAAKHGPYDAILFGGAVEQIPQAVLDQLKENGRICALFADGAMGQCRIGFKTGARVAWRNVFDAVAPVLPGFMNKPEFVL
jgi:protein-L-isoaspartate(D-aspartate) O-methyltransferase